MRITAGLVALVVVSGMVGQACGSSDNKKKVLSPRGGESGEGGQNGGAGDGTTNQGGGGAGAPTGAGAPPGAGAPTGGAGSPSEAGAGGGGPGECPTGFAECDGDLSEPCEQDLTDVATCGACDVSCVNEHGDVTCSDLSCAVTSCDDGYGDCNGDGSDGCETLLTDNDEHCGACNRDCTAVGAVCAVDTCGDIPVREDIGIAPGGAFNQNAWAFSTEHGIFHMTKVNGTIKRFPLDGSEPQTIWAITSGQSGNETLTLDGPDVLWAQFGTPNVVRKKAIAAPAAMLPTDAFYPEYMPVYLRLQGDDYYWISGDFGQPGYVYRRSRTAAQADAGTRIVNVAQGSATSISGFAVTTDAIYWVTADDGDTGTPDNDIMTVPLTGGVPTAVPGVPGSTDGIIKDQGNFTISPSLTALGDTLYFSRTIGDSPLNGIYKYKAGDAAPTKVAEGDNITTFALGPQHVFFGLLNQPGIWRAPLSGGQAVRVGQGYHTVVAGTDADFAYIVFVNVPGYIYKVYQ